MPHRVLCSNYLEQAYQLTENASEILPLDPYLKHKGNVFLKSEQYERAIVFYELYLDQYIHSPRHFLLEAENDEIYANLAECYEKEQESDALSNKNLRKHLTAVLILSMPFVVWAVFRRKRGKRKK